jgi:hypothetical protein
MVARYLRPSDPERAGGGLILASDASTTRMGMG